MKQTVIFSFVIFVTKKFLHAFLYYSCSRFAIFRFCDFSNIFLFFCFYEINMQCNLILIRIIFKGFISRFLTLLKDPQAQCMLLL